MLLSHFTIFIFLLFYYYLFSLTVFEQAESIWNSDEFVSKNGKLLLFYFKFGHMLFNMQHITEWIVQKNTFSDLCCTCCVTRLGCGQDNDSDNDYEGPDQEEEGGNYICAATEPQTAEQQDSDESHEDTFEPPSYSQTLKPPRPQRPASPQDCHSRGTRKQLWQPICNHMLKHISIAVRFSLCMCRSCACSHPCWKDLKTSTSSPTENEPHPSETFQSRSSL